MKKSLLISLLLLSLSPLGFGSSLDDYYITVYNKTDHPYTLYDHWHSCVSKDDSTVESISVAAHSETEARMVPHSSFICDMAPGFSEELHEALKGVGDKEEFILRGNVKGTHKFDDVALNPANEKVKLVADSFHDSSHVTWQIKNVSG